jgi:GTP cyclohydrolase-4
VDWEEVARRARDVQYERPEVPLGIPAAGIGGLRVPLSGIREDSVELSEGIVYAFVDLPPGMRGVNMSRSVRAVLESLEGARSLADLASSAASRLLELHEYSSTARVVVRASAFRAGEAPASGLRSPARFLAMASASADRSGAVRSSVGAAVLGMTACPCGEELMRAAAGGCPAPATHTQRAYLRMEASPAGSTSISRLRSVAAAALGAEPLPLLRRPDEAAVIHGAVSGARFAEDAFRLAALGFARSHPSFPPDGTLRLRVRSLESIHGHDVIVEGSLSGRELRALLGPG